MGIKPFCSAGFANRSGQGDHAVSLWQRVKNWREWPVHGDLSKIRNISWVVGLILGALWALAKAFGFSFSSYNLSSILLIASMVMLLIVSSWSVIWNWHLRRQHADFLTRQDEAATLVVKAQYRADAFKDMMATARSVDHVMMIARRSNGDHDAERRSAIYTALVGCSRHIVPKVPYTQRRIAFMTYDRVSDHWTVLAHVNLSENSVAHVEEKLTGDIGLAAAAMRHPKRQMVYVPDVSSPEARAQGYTVTQDTNPEGCMACLGVWINDTFLGVLSADCPMPYGFEEDDRLVIEAFAGKIQLAYGVLPLASQ